MAEKTTLLDDGYVRISIERDHPTVLLTVLDYKPTPLSERRFPMVTVELGIVRARELANALTAELARSSSAASGRTDGD